MKKYNVRLLDKYDDLNHFKLFKKEVKKLKATRKKKRLYWSLEISMTTPLVSIKTMAVQ